MNKLSKLNKGELFILFFWTFGNFLIMSAVLSIFFYLSSEIDFYSYFVIVVMVLWVFGQLMLAEKIMRREDK